MKLTTITLVFFLVSATLAYACQKQEPTLTITPEVSLIPSEITPTLQVTIEPSSTIAPTFTPTPTVGQNATVQTHGDGLSDGRSSCPECTKPHPAQPVNPPSTGRAL